MANLFLTSLELLLLHPKLYYYVHEEIFIASGSKLIEIVIRSIILPSVLFQLYEPRHEKTEHLHMRKQIQASSLLW